MSKKTYTCRRRPIHVIRTQRGMSIIEKDRVHVKRDECMSKETYLCQKRRSHVKRANLGENDRVARDLRPHAKRDQYMSNEIYSCQKTPFHRNTILKAYLSNIASRIPSCLKLNSAYLKTIKDSRLPIL